MFGLEDKIYLKGLFGIRELGVRIDISFIFYLIPMFG